MMSILLDRFLSTRMLVVWLLVCLAGLGWLHIGKLVGFSKSKVYGPPEPIPEVMWDMSEPPPREAKVTMRCPKGWRYINKSGINPDGTVSIMPGYCELDGKIQ